MVLRDKKLFFCPSADCETVLNTRDIALNHEESQLVLRCQNGDQKAYEKLAKHAGPAIARCSCGEDIAIQEDQKTLANLATSAGPRISG